MWSEDFKCGWGGCCCYLAVRVAGGLCSRRPCHSAKDCSLQANDSADSKSAGGCATKSKKVGVIVVKLFSVWMWGML